MALDITHSTVVVTPDDGSSEVGSDEWNASHSISGTLPPENVEAPGADTQVLFNDSDALGADAGLTYNKTTDVLTAVGGVDLDSDTALLRLGASQDAILGRDAANTLALVNSTNAQAFRWYRTFTDTSNYERGALNTGASYVELAAETAGTGTDNIDVYLTPAGGGNIWTDQVYKTTDGFQVVNGVVGSTNINMAVSQGATGIRSVTTWGINWTSQNAGAVSVFGGTVDAGVYRSAAGIVEINNGTVGTFRDIRVRKLLTPMTGELTIAAGVITVTGGYHNVDTQDDDATDDLDTINGGVDGQRLVLRANNDGRTVVVKDSTGNIELAGGDFSLDNTQDTIELIFDNALSAWLEISRSDNTA